MTATSTVTRTIRVTRRSIPYVIVAAEVAIFIAPLVAPALAPLNAARLLRGEDRRRRRHRRPGGAVMAAESKKMLLRLPPSMHAQLKEIASAEGTNVSALIVNLLASSIGCDPAHTPNNNSARTVAAAGRTATSEQPDAANSA